jgi:5'-deoxynucleotidase YfbR-like HD superfamily hydrolase
MAALMHDVPEQQFGDIPSPAKRAMGAESKKALQTAEDNFLGDAALYFPLSIEEERLLKAADILGGLWNCILERRLGNTTKALKLAYTNFSQYAKEVLKGEVELLIHNYIDGAYHDGSN